MDLLGYGSDSQVVKTGITVLPGGNVGIGTTSPIQMLDLTNASSLTPSIRLQNTYSAGYLSMGSVLGVNSYIGLQAGVSPSSSLNTPTLVVTNAGTVGIGTTNPLGNLHVHSSSTGWTNAITCYQPNTANGNGNLIVLGKTLTGYNNLSIQYAHIGDGSQYNYGCLQMGGVGGILCWNGYGNVGIGTTTPTTKLDVYASATGGTTQANITSWAPEASTTNVAALNLRIRGAGGGSVDNLITAQYNGSGTGTYSLAFNPGGNPTPLVNMLASGNIGIGTTNPGAKLDVNGVIQGRSGVRSYSTDFTYSSETPTWNPGDEGSWAWGGKCFLVTFCGAPDNSGVGIRGAYIVFHSRGGALNDSYSVATPLYNAYISSVTTSNTGMTFTFNSSNAQVVHINVLVINSE
jgi:hypothetical protein